MSAMKRPWPVLFLCCILAFNASGLAFGLGAIFTDIMDTFRVSRASAALVPSLCGGIGYGAGVVTGPFLKSQGPRLTVMTGSVLASVGCVAAYLATHISHVVLGLGALAGLGVSCNYLTAQAMAGIMFHDVRGLALSVVSISGAAGTAVFPLLLRYLANVYTLRGTFLVLAAFNFQMVLCGMLIGLFAPRQRNGTVDQRGREGRVETKTAVEDCIVQYPSQRQRSDCLEKLTPLSTGVETCCPENANHNITELVEEAGGLGLDELTPLSTGVEMCCPEDANHQKITELIEEAEEHPGGMRSSRSALNDAGSALSDVSRDDICRKPSAVTASEERKHSAQDTQMGRNCKHHAGNGEVDDVVKEENVLCLPKRHAHPPSPDKALLISAKKAVRSEIPFDKTEQKSNTAVFSRASEKPDERSRRLFSKRRRDSRQNFFAGFRGSSWLSFAIFRNTSCLQLEILRKPKYILVILLGFTVMMSFIQPSLFMTDMMKSKRLTVQDGTFFIFIIFSGNIAGRTLAGVLYQLHKSGILIVYSTSIVMCGMTSFCYLFAVEYAHLLAVSLFFGISFGIYIATTPMVILEILGPGRFTVGMGYSYFLGGVTLLVAGPYGGSIRDLTNSYKPLFYVTLVHGLAAGLLLLVTALRCPQRS